MTWTPAAVHPAGHPAGDPVPAPARTPRQPSRHPAGRARTTATTATTATTVTAVPRRLAGRDLGAPRLSAPQLGAHGLGAHHLRLTRRGRLVVLLALVTLLLAAFSLGRVGSQAAPRGGDAPAPLAQTTVQPGETLWAVAKRVDPGHDPRGLVMRIQDLNHLEGGLVQAGQLLLLPR